MRLSPIDRAERVCYVLFLLCLVVGTLSYVSSYINAEWAFSSPTIPFFLMIVGGSALLMGLAATLGRVLSKDDSGR
ncbi:hypothetical protein VVR84_03940 [Kocuria carniphila]|uniref:DUF3955 domain-containing protein n=1 Tax=Kocuria carniphila TaxID=262208 RepID=A0ABV3V1E8_9MICC